MTIRILSCLLYALCTIGSVFAKPVTSVYKPAKPLLLIFPIGIVSSPNADKDELKAAFARSRQAARVLRDQFSEGNVADALLYDPESSVVVRGLTENKIKLANPKEPLPDERIAVGRAIGASHVLLVFSLPDPHGGTDLEMQATTVKDGKAWSRRTQANRADLHTIATPNDQENYLASAVRFLALQFLNGPLHDLTTGATPADMLPPVVAPAVEHSPETVEPKPAAVTPIPKPIETPIQPTVHLPTVDVAPAEAKPTPLKSSAKSVEEDEQTKAAREQAESLLGAGDADAAIALLRQAITRSPLATAPRAVLVRAYVAAGRGSEAASEARRALTLLPPDDSEAQKQLVAQITDGLSHSGNPNAARNVYGEIVNAQPDAVWARVALGDLYRTQGQISEAETQYRTALKQEPKNRAAREGFATLLGERGDFKGALDTLTAGNRSTPQRTVEAALLFDRVANRLAERLYENRRIWQSGKMSRETFYRATQAEQERALGLLAAMRQIEPPNSDVNAKSHRQRILAGSLLAQCMASMLTFLETNEPGASDKTSVLMSDYRREMANLR